MSDSHFAILGTVVFDTVPDPAVELSACSHAIMFILTCRLAVSRFATKRVGLTVSGQQTDSLSDGIPTAKAQRCCVLPTHW